MSNELEGTKFFYYRTFSKARLIQRGFRCASKTIGAPISKQELFFLNRFGEPTFFVRYICGLPFYSSGEQKFPTKKQVLRIIKGKYIPQNKFPLPCLLDEHNPVFKGQPYNVNSFIYLIHTDYPEFGYKIGKSDTPDKRSHTIGLKMPFNVKCYRNFPVDEEYALSMEKALHNYFEHKRINGEWFNLSKRDLRNIDRFFKEGHFYECEERGVFIDLKKVTL